MAVMKEKMLSVRHALGNPSEKADFTKFFALFFSDTRHMGGMHHAIKNITMFTLNDRDVVVLEYYEGEDRGLVDSFV